MKSFAIITVSVCTMLAIVSTTRAQTVTPIFSFNNTNGSNPAARLTLGPDGNLYGTTEGGGSANEGTIFKVTTNGILTTLVNFNGDNGSYPTANLTFRPYDGNFYGTTPFGGGYDSYGTVFKITTNGTLTTLVDFFATPEGGGTSPNDALTLGPDGYFYGTTGTYTSTSYSSTNHGTVFQMMINADYSSSYVSLATFHGTNGAAPFAGVTLGPDGEYYGTTVTGGDTNLDSGEGDGTAFKVTTKGVLTTLVNFDGTNGAIPYAGLTLGADGNFYGTTFFGGSANFGTVFRLTTNGSLTTLVNFNRDNGAYPYASLTLGPYGYFYGTTKEGGFGGAGTVFVMTTDGALMTLSSLGGIIGVEPMASLTMGPDGNLYGTAWAGGSADLGTIFQVKIPPAFMTSPTNQSTVIGHGATFNTQVLGPAPFACQWLFNGAVIAGATNTSLTISPAGISEIGNYQLVVTNAYGSVTNQAASLNVVLEPNIYAISNGVGSNWTVYVGSYPNSTNWLSATTNLLLNQWQVIATNITDSNGLAQFLDTTTPGVPQKFYRLSYP